MSKNEELIAELRQWARPNTTHSEKLVNRAAERLEAQDARIEELEAELASLEENRHVAAQLSHQYRNRAERAEQERDAAIAEARLLQDRWVGAGQERDAYAAVIAEALRVVRRDRIASANLDAAELADILISVPSDVLAVYTTRIREEAVGKDEA